MPLIPGGSDCSSSDLPPQEPLMQVSPRQKVDLAAGDCYSLPVSNSERHVSNCNLEHLKKTKQRNNIVVVLIVAMMMNEA